MGKDNPKIKQVRVQRRWSSQEVDIILSFLKDTIQKGHTVGKPTEEIYFSSMLSAINIINCTVNQLKNKVRNMKTSYTKAVQFRGQTGQGVLQNEGEASLKLALLKRCPEFDYLDEVYGVKLNINPPSIVSIPPPSQTNDNYMNSSCEDVTSFQPEVIFGLPGKSSNSDLHSNEALSEQVPSDESLTQHQNEINSVEQPNAENDLSKQKKSKKRSINNGALEALAEARNERSEVEKSRLKMEMTKFDFEKEKWQMQLAMEKEKLQFEQEARKQTLDLEHTRLKNENENFRYECQLKYKTQIKIAKLSNNKDN